jgi:ribosomal protein L29
MMADPLMKQAKRDVRIAKRPQKQAIRRAARSGKQDFNEAQQRVSQVTQAMLGQLAKIPGAYAGQTSGIIGDVTSGIGALGEQLGQNTIGQVPEAERAAGIANVQQVGAGAIEQIAGQQQNMADYLASGAQQGAVQGAVTSRNYLKDYANFQKDIRQQKVDLQAGSKDDILQRLDQLKQEQFDRSMALKQLGMQQAQIDQANRSLAAQQKYYEDYLKLLRKKKGGPGPGSKGRTDDTSGGTTTPEFGYPYWGKSETQFGGQPTGALQPAGPAPQTPLSPTAEPYTLVQWLQTQPLQTQAGLQAATAQIMQWLQAHGQEAVLAADGTLSLSTLASPVVYDVIQHFNAMIGGA